jgi:hypothetical protein
MRCALTLAELACGMDAFTRRLVRVQAPLSSAAGALQRGVPCCVSTPRVLRVTAETRGPPEAVLWDGLLRQP